MHKELGLNKKIKKCCITRILKYLQLFEIISFSLHQHDRTFCAKIFYIGKIIIIKENFLYYFYGAFFFNNNNFYIHVPIPSMLPHIRIYEKRKMNMLISSTKI